MQSQHKEATRQETEQAAPLLDEAYRVILFNDDIHTFDEVILQIIKAVRCTRAKAEKHTWEVHTRGSSIVYRGALPDCLRVSAILEEIELTTEIQTS
ncbi:MULTISPECIES: ATP-dependent Clp protease adaptor ClpS [Prosthecochloris]|uniref:ATP-dependent Clp protease adaptor ClpS n=1 Tax=Prosthecochloris vibrioformis TaxID=1098 RepID=A0A5C4S2H1_PROVB|nr:MULTISPECIES: ATP-dependent Clp protease adaptor ClpS [Prosthecochloris]ANT63866.1 ATP-dependent Clp protease adaptor [Prosthecochloris sp. CIB 2401]TNJ37614.1 ATP-dependent Clp protease adaptor ClpS [Prosthecochloris vibrioformis]